MNNAVKQTAEEAAEAREVAKTILLQLGGNRFAAMTGSKDFLILDCKKPYGLRMKLSRNKSGANYLAIFLEESDTYRMEFKNNQLSTKTLELKSKEIETLENVYAEDLQKMFTATTGLYTRL